MSTPAPYTVEAYNLSWAAENKIHDDTVAKRFGFTGGLVPGVEVFAYAAHAAVERYGRAWLEFGQMEMRFLSPVYDGQRATVHARAAGEGLDISVESAGKTCATGHASPPADRLPPRPFEPVPWREPPEMAARPPATDETLAVGAILCARPVHATAEVAAQYLADVRERDPIYAREGLLHPGWLLRRCNAVLVDNVVLPPWIHVGSAMQLVSLGRVGETVTACARVAANYERKGHRLVDLDAVVLGDGNREIAHVRHTAIYRLRGEVAYVLKPRQSGRGSL